jgi:S1-C subfamily serine protease
MLGGIKAGFTNCSLLESRGDIMPKLVCQCGLITRLTAERIEKHSGQRLKCEACGRIATVPELKTKEAPLNELSTPRQASSMVQQRNRRWVSTHPRLKWICGIVVVAIALASVGLTVALTLRDSSRNTQTEPAPVEKVLTRHTRESIIHSIEPSVVTIEVPGVGQGAGFVADLDGTIVTNYHVIEGAKSAFVIFNDGTRAVVKGFVGISPGKDLALRRIDVAKNYLKPLRLADVLPLKGERVLAFGSPRGLSSTVAEGIVSGIRTGDELQNNMPQLLDANVYRDVLGYEADATWVQTTAPINSGNSGGPLVNSKTQVVGVNTISWPKSQNLNFAISTLHIRQLLNAKHALLSFAFLPQPKPQPKPKPQIDPPEKNHPKDAGKLKIAQKAIGAERYVDALQSLSEISPELRGAEYWSLMGYIRLATEDYSESVKCYIESLKREKSNANTWLHFALATRLDPKLKNYDLVETACRTTLTLNPTSADAYIILSQSTLSKKLAFEYLKRAIAIDDAHLGARFHLGCEYVQNRDDDKAIEHFQKALALSMNSKDYFALGGSEWTTAGGMKYTIDAYSREGSLGVFLQLQLAATTLNRRKYDGAVVRLCEDALRVEPTNGNAYMIKGMYLRGKGARLKNAMLVKKGDDLQQKGMALGGDIGLALSMSAGNPRIFIVRK